MRGLKKVVWDWSYIRRPKVIADLARSLSVTATSQRGLRLVLWQWQKADSPRSYRGKVHISNNTRHHCSASALPLHGIFELMRLIESIALEEVVFAAPSKRSKFLHCWSSSHVQTNVCSYKSLLDQWASYSQTPGWLVNDPLVSYSFAPAPASAFAFLNTFIFSFERPHYHDFADSATGVGRIFLGVGAGRVR